MPLSRLAVYPGTFDPITLGHVDVVTRACTIFDEVVLGVAHNAAKAGQHLFDLDTRLALARTSLAHLHGVRVEVVPGLLADFCRDHGASAIVKGLLKGLAAIGEVGSQLVHGLFNGISNAATWLYEKVKGWASSVVGWIKDFFGIHSPSKVFADEVGKFTQRFTANA